MSTIDSVGSSAPYTPTSAAGQSAAKAEKTAAQSSGEDQAYVLEKGTQQTSATYSKPTLKPDMAKIRSIQAGYNKSMDAFQAMVKTLITKQGKAASFNGIDLSSEKGILKLKSMIEGGMEVDQDTITAAKAAIGEDGEFGVEKTSDRLVQFAIAASGGDKAGYEKMKSAIEKGFDAARRAWGGKLPDISEKTYEATMKKLEDWKNS